MISMEAKTLGRAVIMVDAIQQSLAAEILWPGRFLNRFIISEGMKPRSPWVKKTIEASTMWTSMEKSVLTATYTVRVELERSKFDLMRLNEAISFVIDMLVPCQPTIRSSDSDSEETSLPFAKALLQQQSSLPAGRIYLRIDTEQRSYNLANIVCPCLAVMISPLYDLQGRINEATIEFLFSSSVEDILAETWSGDWQRKKCAQA